MAAISLLLTGCWDLEEIENRAFVLAVGFDRTEDGQVECTVQLPRPQALNYARGQSPSAPTEQFIVTSAKGPSAWEALLEVDKQTARRVYLGHLQAVVLGEDLARDGTGPVLDALMRHARINRQARVFVAANAGQIIRQPVLGELLPALYFSSFYDSHGNEEDTAELRLWRAWHEVTMPLQSCFIPFVNVREDQFRFEGIGLVARGKLAGRLDHGAARGFNWLRGTLSSGSVAVQAAGRGFTVHTCSTHRRVSEAWWDGDTPHMAIRIRVAGDLAENSGMTGATVPEVWAQIERAEAAVVKDEAEQALRSMQQAGADSLELGEFMRVADPRGWDLEKWNAGFPKAEITITTEFTLENTGDIQEAR